MKRNKLKILCCLLAAVFCTAAFSLPVSADSGYYYSSEDGDVPPVVPFSGFTVGTEPVEAGSPDGAGGTGILWDVDAESIDGILSALLPSFSGETLTPDGNLTLIDDIRRVESCDSGENAVLKDKQFITVETKDGHIFYIVIDRSGEKENVYFLNMVDDADLLALLGDGEEAKETVPVCTCREKCQPGDVDTDCPVCRNTMSRCTGKEKTAEKPVTEKQTETPVQAVKAEKEQKTGKGLLLIVLLILGGGGYAVYRFMIKGRKTHDGNGSGPDGNFEEDDGPEYETEEETDENEQE